MKRIILALSIALFVVQFAHPQRKVTTRRGLKTEHQSTAPFSPRPRQTVTVADSAVKFAGFDKPLQSLNESLFLTNLSDFHFNTVYITLDYFDRHNRKLHSRSQTVIADIPPGETRLLTFPSWDRNKSFYYTGGRTPRGKSTGFTVKCRLDSVEIKP